MVLTLEQLNYTLNDALQNEHDRSVAVMIALGAIGGLRRSEAVALKVGRYYHDDRMETGEEMWQLNDFKSIRGYYEEHNELIMIDEAITHQKRDVLGFPKDNIIRMVGKPRCLDEIIEYAMEQRMQVCNIIGSSIGNSDRIYMPLKNVIQQSSYSCQKVSRKWTEYQQRRNKRMEQAGLEPIPVIRYHDLRHTHASLLTDELSSKKISRNMGHVIPGEGQVNNTTTKVYIHDMQPDRTDIIRYWDSHIKLDWEKALRVDINAPGNRAHVNGSGHVVIKDEDKKRAMELHKRFLLTEEEEALLLCSQ
jgi:integrase